MTTKLFVLAGFLPFAVSAQVQNPGFETAGAGAGSAANWTVTQAAGGPVYAVRTNSNPHSGSYNFEVHLASTGAGPVVEFTQAAVPVTGGTVYPFTFYANALSGSAGYNAQWRILWNAGGDTGYQTFSPGNNTYAFVSNSVTAPAAATSATIYFHFAGAAIPAQSANIDLDDVALGGGGGSGGGGTTTNTPIQVAITRGVGIRWFASNSVTYQVQWSATAPNNSPVWNNLGNPINGNGATNTVFDPTGAPHNYYQVLSIQ
ncbi:MAG: hypothetical protein U1F98_16830 [Verrucomicrobiota bacterium]